MKQQKQNRRKLKQTKKKKFDMKVFSKDFNTESFVKKVLETFKYLPDIIWSQVCPTLTVNNKSCFSKNSQKNPTFVFLWFCSFQLTEKAGSAVHKDGQNNDSFGQISKFFER